MLDQVRRERSQAGQWCGSPTDSEPTVGSAGMRAIQLTRLMVRMRSRSAEIDEPTGDGVVVEVHAAGAAFPDALLTRGLYQYQPDPPFVLGAEIAGVVRSAPDGRARASRRPRGRPDDAHRRHGRGRGAAPDRVFKLPDNVSFDGGRGPAVQRPDHVLRADRPWPAAAGRDGAGARGGRRHRNVDAAAGVGARGVARHRGGQHRGQGRDRHGGGRDRRRAGRRASRTR